MIDWETCKEKQTVSTSHTLPGIPVDTNGNYTDENGQQWICDEIDFERGVYIQRIGVIALDGSESMYREARSSTLDSVTYDTYRWLIVPTIALPSANVTTGICSHFTYDYRPIGTNSLDCALVIYPVDGKIYARYDAYETVEDLRLWLSEQYSAGTPVTIVYPLATPIETALTDVELTAYRATHTNCPNTVIVNNTDAHMEVSYNVDMKTYLETQSYMYLTDANTGKRYHIQVIDGVLTVSEASS